MPYCWKCGTELPDKSKFCPQCGAEVSRLERVRTGFDQIGRDVGLQGHWIRRIIAIVIDSVIVGIGAMILAGILFFPFLIVGWPSLWAAPWNWFQFPFMMGLIYILYFTIAESGYGYTLGKRIMGLRVITLGGETPSLEKAFIRNISKIYWILLLLDVIGGLATSGDPRQKYSDRFAGTLII
ncbi:MAG: zinc-ribbon domain-containing protein [Nitrososphaeria archaeon]|nr:zinc-ribbon domain-containing protein [Nitrososphaeria archaeon]NIQ33387.1 zinc-ribbon domain-containing protein [Nitrososphaeria archaeon]